MNKIVGVVGVVVESIKKKRGIKILLNLIIELSTKVEEL